MLLSHRAVVAPALDASIETRALVHSRFRLHLVHNRGVVCEDDLVRRAFDRKGALARPVLTVILAGRARLRVHGEASERWLERGDFALFPSKGALSMRQEGEPGASFASVALEWDPDTLGPRPGAAAQGRLAPDALARLEALARAVRVGPDAPADEAAAHLSALLALLRAEGAPLDAPAPDALLEPVNAATERLSRTLDRLLSRLPDRPMAVDLDAALGLSARQVARVVSAFNTRFGFNADGWRDTLNRRRITIGAALMSARAATTEGVSAHLGYSSPTAFCRAMAEAGLPAPGAVAQAVHAMR